MSTEQGDLGSIINPIKFRNQDFEALLSASLSSQSLFTDPIFSANQTSIGMPADPDPKKVIKWQRPKEISPNAMFVEGTTGTTDICQGQLGDCWLLAALSCLTMHPSLFVKVVLPNQSMTDSYAGIFHFRFWQYGEWVEVVVDDRLPVRGGRLLFSYSRTNNEFWSALVEKAYAKLMGSYSSLKGGNISEAMEDFTGGIARSRPVKTQTPRVLWRIIKASLSRGSLLSCFIKAANVHEVGTVSPDGLVKGHAYAITEAEKVKKKSGEVLLLRLRNPWGFVEYCGPWSDKCKDWDGVDSAEIKRIELKKADDGEFWISVEDFCRWYDTVELCSMNPDPLEEQGDDPSSTTPIPEWTLSSHQCTWVPGYSAGGSRKYKKSFWRNPQFQLVLSEQDQVMDEEEEEQDQEGGEEEEGGANLDKDGQKEKAKDKQCTVLIELLQKDRRQRDRVNFLFIAFHIYKVPVELQNTGILNESFFSGHSPVARSGKYQALRAVWRKLRLVPGHYVIVTSCLQPNLRGDFFLRIFSQTGNTLGTNDVCCPSNFVMAVMPVLPEDKATVEKVFDEAAGPNDRLNAVDVMKLVNSVLQKEYHLSLEICRQLIFGENAGGQGTLTRVQAETVLSSVRQLQSTFLKFDEDSSGTMSPFELSLALQACGVQCDSQVLQVLWERFGSGDIQLAFPGFVSCVARLRKLFALYETESSQEVKKRGINNWLLRLLVV